jgi:DNA-binding transcriptional ArsR family regulator
VLRIHFTANDLGRVRIAAAPDPLWELSLSMHVLRMRNSDPWLAQWKSGLLRLLEPQAELRHEVSLPLALNPPLGYFPDFLTPAEGLRGFSAGLEAVLSTPQRRVRQEMAAFGAAHPTLTRLTAGIGTASADRMRDLGRAMRRYHDVALRPIWDRIQTAFDAERALRMRCMSDGGVSALLNTMHSAAVFRDGVLEISNYIASRDLYLDGRGLLLVPSYIKRGDKPMVLADPQLTPVLIFPISQEVRAVSDRRTADLSTLLGRTRATVLELAANGATTGGMAVSLGVSAAAVSQHIGVLRQGGLVMSVRDRNRVHHGLTTLGRALLEGFAPR